ncbi:alginate lyase family protein [Stenotrophomonas sp. CFBP 13724]|uniref:oligoalginate lyase n=1 Tax=Stenotrophomonas sp. CFBP 13724 TaxID=2775298 RepID=UPI001781DBDF|nr:oligoalginate lyase [Stenotrophomonas sp. CFBP 13724]MBD8643968.1 alginate lyase family protein [Stenotrophomonas sp. CFBP 13724]
MKHTCLSLALAVATATATLALLPVSAAFAAAPAAAESSTAPVLVTAAQWQQMASDGARYPWFAKEQARNKAMLEKMMKAGIDVPFPKDKGGGRTHEQHKRNYQALLAAGTLYRLTGDSRYVDYARRMLLEYATLYPTLGPHPEGRGQIPGRVFWQVLNDSVWLVNAVQGYDAIRNALPAKDRQTIDDNVFRPMAEFLASEPKNFDQIHNHSTWAVAATGMTGYVLRDPELVEKSLRGSRKDDEFGFLRQVDLLFSPDGYYEEGPYYQRYALAPFLLFANAIERNEPQRRIFERRDGVLLKAVDVLVQTSYDGLFFPINDAILDKGVDTEELVAGIGIAYARSGDDRLLSVAEQQGRLLLTPEGLKVAQGLAAGKAKPFDYTPMLLRDGPDGDQGGLAILRMGGERGQTLVQKDTMQGMGHGHFDKLNWLFYDNGQRVVTDYGSARFLNVEAKRGGIYLAENRSWAKQTIAHNTLVVDEKSHFNGDWKVGEEHAPTVRFFEAGKDTQVASATMRDAYPGVVFTRTQALLQHPELGLPVVLDLLQVSADKPARFDLPLHFNGHIVSTGFQAERFVDQRPVLGRENGYQHLWLDARSQAGSDPRTLAWLLDGRFYSYRFGSSAPSQALLVESGANDPEFNLRREPALVQRVDGQRAVSFFSVLEPHGEYNGTAEYVHGADSQIRDLKRARGSDAELVELTLASGARIALGVADDSSADVEHTVSVEGRSYRWRGSHARIDRAAGKGDAR